MSDFEGIELQDCPFCNGPGLIQVEYGWCVYVGCMDCDAHTIEIPFKNEKEKAEAAEKVAHLWNIGKAISGVPI